MEEFRVLPALLSDAAIVSQDVPLREQLHHHPFVIRSKCEDMPETVCDLHENCAAYRRKLLHDPHLAELLLAMRESNIANVAAILGRAAS